MGRVLRPGDHLAGLQIMDIRKLIERILIGYGFVASAIDPFEVLPGKESRIVMGVDPDPFRSPDMPQNIRATIDMIGDESLR